MITLPSGRQIPEKFTIAKQEISIQLLDKIPGNNYGSFCDAKNLIKIAKTVEVTEYGNTETIELNDAQIINSLYHEVVHCFQFYYNNQYDEAQAQVYANFIYELIETSK